MSEQSEDLNQRLIACQHCERLIKYTRDVALEKVRRYREWEYWGKPVPNFGDLGGELLVVGLAPAAHGANRTGRMFTGDRSGDWLYSRLHAFGFANQVLSESIHDGLKLDGCCITAVCHCAPPGNKPTREELSYCRSWLFETLQIFSGKAYLILGKLAWDETLKALKEFKVLSYRKRPIFSHGAVLDNDRGERIFGSYHPSQQNTFTRTLTPEMFDAVFKNICLFLDSGKP